tara:strand:- start:7813 stop:9438 length:1626 start_codon:yes stop_codon:yes gene_type:complete
MAEEVKVNLKAEFGSLRRDLQDVTTELVDIKDESKKASKGLGGIKKAVTGVGAVLTGGLFKAGAVIFEKLMEIFMGNQRVVDAFAVATNLLQKAFNDFVGFLDKNVGGIINVFADIFTNPLQSVKNLATAIKNNLIERFKSLIDAAGFAGKAFKRLFAGDFAGALESAKEAGKELVDVATGVDGTVDKVRESATGAAQAVKDYALSTFDAAKNQVNLNKQAQLAEAQNAKLLLQFSQEAELQRQIRDDTSQSIEDRIAANEELGNVLDRQAEVMMANAQDQVDAAQAALDLDKENLDLQIALINAETSLIDVQETVTGLRSEQLTNTNSLLQEQKQLQEEIAENETQVPEKPVEEENPIQKDIDLLERKKQMINDALDATIQAAGEETKVGKALFLAKQAMMIREQVMEAKATLQRITLRASEASVDVAKGSASTAKVGFPANIPLLAAFAIQAAGIIMSIKSAVNATKGAASGMGGGGGGASAPASAPPDFNIVGASPMNQLAETIGGESQKPIKAFVTSSDVSTAQSLDRNIIETASIG